mgnify:FL=1
MDKSQFRTDFPEFADAVRFPNTMLDFWSGIGEAQISADRFGNLYAQAVELFTAHNITLASGNVEASAAGGSPGGKTGAIQQKKVGSVAVSYDNASSMLPGAGHWNLTTYGKQYIQLVRLIGTGCVQL